MAFINYCPGHDPIFMFYQNFVCTCLSTKQYTYYSCEI